MRMIPYARQSVDDSDVAAVEAVLRSDFLTQGPVIPKFEAAVAAYCGAKHAVAVSNATSALHLAALAVGLKPGGLLWTSPISFVASANCARYCGADVDFVDIDARTYCLDPAALERDLLAAQRAGRLPDVVVAVDFAGHPYDHDAIAALRARFGFRVIDDASHAIGAEYRAQRIGGIAGADVTVFSFHPVKIVTTGEGGIAATDDEKIADRMRLLRSHGVTRDPGATAAREWDPWAYEQIELGFNYRLTDVAAALGIAQLRRIDEFLDRRQAIARRYDAGLARLPLTLPYRAAHVRSSLHLYPVQVTRDAPASRREVYDGLRERGIAANVHYIPIHTQPYYRDLGFKWGDFPTAEAYYAGTLSLPMFPALTDAEVDRTVAALREILAA